jgi:hypothetical protein
MHSDSTDIEYMRYESATCLGDDMNVIQSNHPLDFAFHTSTSACMDNNMVTNMKSLVVR